jgi:hypothetical protein
MATLERPRVQSITVQKESLHRVRIRLPKHGTIRGVVETEPHSRVRRCENGTKLSQPTAEGLLRFSVHGTWTDPHRLIQELTASGLGHAEAAELRALLGAQVEYSAEDLWREACLVLATMPVERADLMNRMSLVINFLAGRGYSRNEAVETLLGIVRELHEDFAAHDHAWDLSVMLEGGHI